GQQPSGQTSGPVDQTPQQKAEDMTAPENFTSLSNIPLIAERRPDMTMPVKQVSRVCIKLRNMQRDDLPRVALLSF
ncbi:hypothetical protein, partial [Parasphingorhabdus sp.]|uniref:hypothetical protein n=1 Tax=Parasphingorhabdus sp. TaxID=2709688 RepID=UPI0032EAE98F